MADPTHPLSEIDRKLAATASERIRDKSLRILEELVDDFGLRALDPDTTFKEKSEIASLMSRFSAAPELSKMATSRPTVELPVINLNVIGAPTETLYAADIIEGELADE